MSSKKDKSKEFFNLVLFELFKDFDYYDKTIYQLNKAFDIFYSRVPSFKNMSAKNQYHILDTALMIKLGADSKGMRQARILTNPPPSDVEKKYDLEYGFEEPEKIDITPIKIKLLK